MQVALVTTGHLRCESSSQTSKTNS